MYIITICVHIYVASSSMFLHVLPPCTWFNVSSPSGRTWSTVFVLLSFGKAGHQGCHVFSLANALQRDRCVVRAGVLGVHVISEAHQDLANPGCSEVLQE